LQQSQFGGKSARFIETEMKDAVGTFPYGSGINNLSKLVSPTPIFSSRG
jgi:hypothetical protein